MNHIFRTKIIYRKKNFFFNFLNKRYLNELSSETLINPSFGLTDEDKLIQKTAYDFSLKELRPNMRKWDKEKYFAVTEMRKAAELGFGAIYSKQSFGGMGLSRFQTSLIIESLSQGDVGTAAFISIHNMCSWILTEFGNEEQINRFFGQMISMEKLASYCLTEPNSGSDAASLQTTAVKKGDYYILNGTKAFISGAGTSDLYFLMCRTGDQTSKGISCIIVEKETEGLSFGSNEEKLGWNCQPTKMVILDNCKVPTKNLIKKEGYGFNIAMKAINGGRINIASCSLGAAQFAIEETIKYIKIRKQFKKKISDFQNTQFKLAEHATELFCSRICVREAAKLLDKSIETCSDDINLVPAIAASSKLIATEKCYKLIDVCLQMFGGYGYLYDYPIQQLLRDTRVNRILEGTNEIMQLIISKNLIKK